MHYHTSEWLLDIYPKIFTSKNESFIVYDNDKIIAIFPLFISLRKKLFQRVAYSSPLFSAFPIFDLTLNDKKLFELSEVVKEYLTKFNHTIIRSTQSSYQRIKYPIANLNCFIDYSSSSAHQVLFLPKNKEDILRNVEGNFRTALKKVNKEEFKIENVTYENINDKIINLLVDCNIQGKLQKMNIESGRTSQFEHFSNLLKSKFSYTFVVKKNDKIVSYAIIFIYKDYAYYSEAYTLRDKEYYGVNNLLQNYIMEILVDKHINYYDRTECYPAITNVSINASPWIRPIPKKSCVTSGTT